jgi:hypothetical protein
VGSYAGRGGCQGCRMEVKAHLEHIKLEWSTWTWFHVELSVK